MNIDLCDHMGIIGVPKASKVASNYCLGHIDPRATNLFLHFKISNLLSFYFFPNTIISHIREKITFF